MLKISKILSAIFCCIFFINVLAQTVKETKKIDGAGLKNLLPNAENKNPVLINFWATWCGPCRVEFPELVKIDADYRKNGLKFNLVSVDNVSLIDSQVPAFLQEYKATMPSYLLDFRTRGEIARAVRQIAPSFPDRYPLTLLFNSNGKLVTKRSAW